MTSISLSGQPGFEPPVRWEGALFGTVRRGDDGSFGRRLLRIAPFILGSTRSRRALLAVKPSLRPVVEEPPRVVFLRAVPRSAPAAPRTAPVIPPKQKVVQRNRDRVVPPKVIPREMPPETPPPMETAQVSETAPTEVATAPGPVTASTQGLGGTGDAPVGVV
jgi:hypothetical protein